MADVVATDDLKDLMRTEGVDENGVPMLLNEKQQMRYARMWLNNGVVSRASFQNELQVLAGIQAIKALGLQPMTALRQTGFMNGQFVVYGDIPIAIVRRSGKLEWMREFLYVVDERTKKYVERSFENSNLHLPVCGAVCIMKHVDECEPYVAAYSKEDAALASLWNKKGPWSTHPHIMLMRKARNVCIQKGFSDQTHCVATEGDVENVPEQTSNQRLRERLEKIEAEKMRLQSKKPSPPFVEAVDDEAAVPEAAPAQGSSRQALSATPEDMAEFEQDMNMSYDEAVEKFSTQKDESPEA